MSDVQPSFSARPIVRFDGRDSDLVLENLLSLQLDDQRGGLATLELRLLNIASDDEGGAAYAFDSDELVSLGKELYLGMGDFDAPISMFRGLVSRFEEEHGVGHPPVMHVFAEDALQGARMRRRTTVHTDLRIADLAEEVAQQLSLRPRVQGFTATLGDHVQINESDLSFLRRLLRRYDGDMQVIEDELHVAPIPDIQRGTLELDAQVDLLKCRLAADLAHQVTSVTVSGYDVDQGRQVGASSAPSDLGPGDGDTGAGWMNRAYGAREEHVGRAPVKDEDEAQALADAIHAARARGFVRVEATAIGNPNIRVGAHLRISGVGTRFENTYVVTRTCHRYDRGVGYETDFEAESAYLGEAR
ncbi:MAG: phage late control D family protein [Alphaproteobacteria bacterium]|nr:phage late control D family protein [Alphaproteobacteria bacterium]MCB9791546.1 phage late control D family protein [Alphaproteobacteria bacterium]